APQGISDGKVSKSWKLLGQACVTTIIDILLFTLMWNILPLRFLILCVSTPFRLLVERSHPPAPIVLTESHRPPELVSGRTGLWFGDTAPSVTDNTTRQLEQADKTSAATTDQLRR